MAFDAKLIKLVTRELQDLASDSPEGIHIILNEQNITEVQAEIDGPEGTPYEGGAFRLRLSIPPEYPSVPPKGYFITKIFHPNVSTSGEICVNVLKKDWTPDMGLKHVLVVIKCLLVHTNPESALNEEAAKLLLEDYEEFARHARLLTGIHAKKRPGPLTTSHTNAMTPHSAESSQGADKQVPGSPAAKKAKADQSSSSAQASKPAAASAAAGKVKKSLKRL